MASLTPEEREALIRAWHATMGSTTNESDTYEAWADFVRAAVSKVPRLAAGAGEREAVKLAYPWRTIDADGEEWRQADDLETALREHLHQCARQHPVYGPYRVVRVAVVEAPPDAATPPDGGAKP